MTPPRHWPTRHQRALALTLLVVLALAGALSLAGPLVQKHRQYDAAIDDLVFQTQRLERTLAQRDLIEDQRARLREAIESAETTLPPMGVSLAGARLQAHLQALAGRSGDFTVNSVQSLEPVPSDGFIRIAVRIQGHATLESLARFLHLVETGLPVTWVDQVQLQPDRRGTGTTRRLDIALTLTTLMTAEEEQRP